MKHLDVIVIGSGFGGAAIACRLSRCLDEIRALKVVR